MTERERSHGRVRVGRSDLLRLLAQDKIGEMPAAVAARYCGFQRKEKRAEQQFDEREPGAGESAEAAGGTGEDRAEPEIGQAAQLPRMRFLLPIYAEARDPEPEPIAPGDRAEPIPLEDYTVPNVEPPPRPPLTPWSRLVPFLRQALGDRRAGRRVDARRLVRMVASGQPLREIPRVHFRRWAPRAAVLFDWTDEMMPFWDDHGWLRKRLLRECGRHALSLEPLETAPSREVLAKKIPRGVPVLVVGAMGQLARNEPLMRHWELTGDWLRRRGHQLSALLPCPRQRWRIPLAEQWRCAVWDRRPRVPRDRGLRALPAPEHDPGTASVMRLLAPAVIVEPGLLRSVRLLLGSAANVGAEYDAFFHRDSAPCPMWFSFRKGKRDGWLEQQLQPPEVGCEEEAHALIEAYHRTCAPVVAEQARQNLKSRDPTDKAARAERLQRTVHGVLERLREEVRNGADPEESGLAAWAIALVEDQMSEIARQAAFVAELYAVANYRTGKVDVDWPKGIHRDAAEAELQRLRRAPDRELAVEVHLRAGKVVVWRQGKDGQFSALPLAELKMRRPYLSLTARKGPFTLEFSRALGESQRWVIEVGSFLETEALTVETDLRAVHHLAIERPKWAQRMGYDRSGLYAELEIVGVAVRLRWIPPGSFRMGDEQEGPRHEVTITEGFWMAETQTTQELWAAVVAKQRLWRRRIKKAPSKFKGEKRPVEMVSWQDSTGFCELLNELKLGLEFGLPTEAQWEYACRAGTETHFNNGEDLEETLSTMGWYGEDFRKVGTHEVALKAPNDWGLYDMHGNVWEWCLDGRRKYTGGAVEDPIGPLQESARRVLRGGGWSVSAGYCRSAYRAAGGPGLRGQDLGFRLVAGRVSSSRSGAIGLWAEGADAPWPWDRASAPSPESGVTRPRWAERFLEDDFGAVAELELKGTVFRFRWIPPGTFWMGSPDEEAERQSSEGPQHEVRLTKGFWMGETPVTQEQWRAIQGGNPSHFEGLKLPVETVSWDDCEGFARNLSGRVAGLRAGLPTEAQWEYACRAGTETRFNNGRDEEEALEEVGWYDKNSGSGTHEVAQKPANKWGLHDMHGNVDEWCLDGMREYASEPVADPVGPLQQSAERVVRGGSWNDPARYCRSAVRSARGPGFRDRSLGFRLVAGQEQEEPEAI